MHPVDLIFSGDVILDEPDPDFWLDGIAPALRQGISIGHLEVAHTHRGTERKGDVPAPGANPDHLSALKRAGFAAFTLAGNHIADQGAVGIEDTVAELDQLGILHCGAGTDLPTARRPAVLDSPMGRFAILSYNCVGPEFSWAGAHKAGCAYIRVEARNGGPISPSTPLETIDVNSLAELRRDVAQARAGGARVIVALHKGVVHTPAVLAPYEQPLAHAAIDAGADAVVSHHAHILRGIEFHRGKPIFHGLGNGCVVTSALSPGQSHAARAAWAEKRKKLFGFEPDPAYTLAPFHPQAVNAMLARLRVHPDGQIETGFIPVHVHAPGKPLLADAGEAERIARYVAKITTDAGLPALHMTQQPDAVTVHE
jgi:poly-gamma-glutamate capsule biosynthesis protein CapA/YwtB (metallophosphatase superfamily)